VRAFYKAIISLTLYEVILNGGFKIFIAVEEILKLPGPG